MQLQRAAMVTQPIPYSNAWGGGFKNEMLMNCLNTLLTSKIDKVLLTQNKMWKIILTIIIQYNCSFETTLSFTENQPTQSFGNEYQFFLAHVEQMTLQQVLHGYCSHCIDTCGGCTVNKTSGHQLSHHNHLLAIFTQNILFLTNSGTITVIKEYNT